MGSVLVARDGKTLFDKGYGFANLEWQVPNTPATKFRLGSITKQFTAASILLLEERGKLKIDDTVKKYIPDAPAVWDKVTIFHLLTHTSGNSQRRDVAQLRLHCLVLQIIQIFDHPSPAGADENSPARFRSGPA